MSQNKNHRNYFVPGLARGLRVLEIVGAARRPLTVSEIAAQLDARRSSAFRLVYTLRHLGFLQATYNDKAYELGARVLDFGFAYLNTRDVVRISRPHLEQLRDDTGISSHLAVLEGRDVLYLDYHQSNSPFVSNIVSGHRTSAHASAHGWVLLGATEEAEIRARFADFDFPAKTKHTPRSVAQLLDRVKQATRRGFVISRGFYEPGGSSVIAPVRDSAGKVAAVIDISGPDSAFDFARLEDFHLPHVLQAAKSISKNMGGD